MSKEELQNLRTLTHSMRQDTLHNYVTMGLNSSLLTNGCVRHFHQTREQTSVITPHSHRFDLMCLVLSGVVTNTLYFSSMEGDKYQVSEQVYKDIGKYRILDTKYVDRFILRPTVYRSGEWYSMNYNEIHSIWFSKGAQVLFFEGPTVTDASYFLEPMDEYENVDRTLKTEEWMFRKEDI